VEALEALLYGAGGGLAAEVLGLFRLRRQGAPQYLRSPFYWIITVAMIAIGGGVAWVYIKSDVDLTPLLAVNVGASAPLIIGQLVAQAPELPRGESTDVFAQLT
jgi:hypothetical protein